MRINEQRHVVAGEGAEEGKIAFGDGAAIGVEATARLEILPMEAGHAGITAMPWNSVRACGRNRPETGTPVEVGMRSRKNSRRAAGRDAHQLFIPREQVLRIGMLHHHLEFLHGRQPLQPPKQRSGADQHALRPEELLVARHRPDEPFADAVA